MLISKILPDRLQGFSVRNESFLLLGQHISNKPSEAVVAIRCVTMNDMVASTQSRAKVSYSFDCIENPAKFIFTGMIKDNFGSGLINKCRVAVIEARKISLECCLFLNLIGCCFVAK